MKFLFINNLHNSLIQMRKVQEAGPIFGSIQLIPSNDSFYFSNDLLRVEIDISLTFCPDLLDAYQFLFAQTL